MTEPFDILRNPPVIRDVVWPNANTRSEGMHPKASLRIQEHIEKAFLDAAYYGNQSLLMTLHGYHPGLLRRKANLQVAIIASPNPRPALFELLHELNGSLEAMPTADPAKSPGFDLAFAWARTGTEAQSWLMAGDRVSQDFKDRVSALAMESFVDLAVDAQQRPQRAKGFSSNETWNVLISERDRHKDARSAPKVARALKLLPLFTKSFLAKAVSHNDHDSAAFVNVFSAALRSGDTAALDLLLGQEFIEALPRMLEKNKWTVRKMLDVVTEYGPCFQMADYLAPRPRLAEHLQNAFSAVQNWRTAAASGVKTFAGLDKITEYVLTSNERCETTRTLSDPVYRSVLIKKAVEDSSGKLMAHLLSRGLRPRHIMAHVDVKDALSWSDDQGFGLIDYVANKALGGFTTSRTRVDIDRELMEIITIAGSLDIHTRTGSADALLSTPELSAKASAKMMRTANRQTQSKPAKKARISM